MSCAQAVRPLDEALRIYDELGVPLEFDGCRVEPFVERAAFTETVYGWRTLDIPHRTDGGIDLWVVGRVEGPEGTNWGGAAIRNGCFSTVVVSTLTVPVIMHEIGHALGLGHDLRVGSVMYPDKRGAGTWLDERQAEIAAGVAAFLVDECL